MNRLPTLVITACLIAATAANGAGDRIESVKLVPAAVPNKHYISNRAPLAVSPLVKLPIGAIRPEGWLRAQFELQAEGFIGRLTDISPWCRAADNAWLSPNGTGQSPWEELPYWLKGFGDTGYVLNNQRITTEARKWIDGIIASQRADGWFGPRGNLANQWGNPDLWPNTIAACALQSYYEATGDKRVIDLLSKYFRWQLTIPEKDFLKGNWSYTRGADNMAAVYWLYNRTGEAFLLQLAERMWRNMLQWREAKCWRMGRFHRPFTGSPSPRQPIIPSASRSP